jgi:hypothetical protein
VNALSLLIAGQDKLRQDVAKMGQGLYMACVTPKTPLLGIGAQ